MLKSELIKLLQYIPEDVEVVIQYGDVGIYQTGIVDVLTAIPEMDKWKEDGITQNITHIIISGVKPH